MFTCQTQPRRLRLRTGSPEKPSPGFHIYKEEGDRGLSLAYLNITWWRIKHALQVSAFKLVSTQINWSILLDNRTLPTNVKLFQGSRKQNLSEMRNTYQPVCHHLNLSLLSNQSPPRPVFYTNTDLGSPALVRKTVLSFLHSLVFYEEPDNGLSQEGATSSLLLVVSAPPTHSNLLPLLDMTKTNYSGIYFGQWFQSIIGWLHWLGNIKPKWMCAGGENLYDTSPAGGENLYDTSPITRATSWG